MSASDTVETRKHISVVSRDGLIWASEFRHMPHIIYTHSLPRTQRRLDRTMTDCASG